MNTMPLSIKRSGSVVAALRTGVALSITVKVFYCLCTLVWPAAPGPFLNFMSGLFHGVDFTPLVRAAPFSWRGFIEALLVMSVWAFLAGSFYGWLQACSRLR